MISSRPTARDSLLFVYGTLRPFSAVPMARWLRRVARYVGPAVTRGELYDVGRYPCMRTAGRFRERVSGDVYRVAGRRVFRALDRYEARFERQHCLVKLARGASARAWVYRYRSSVVGLPRIVGGDYRAYCEGRSRRPTLC